MASPAALAAFFSESDTHVEIIEQALIALEKESGNPEVINELFRAVHSLKGNAGLVGLTEIHGIATAMETMLDEIRSTNAKVGQQSKDELFDDLDKVKALIEKARGGSAPGAANAKGEQHEEEHRNDEHHEEHGDEHAAQHEEHHAARHDGKRSYLTFLLGREEYGFMITAVREIILRRHITHVPNSRDFVAGIMNLRGMVIPVIDAKRKLGFAEAEDKAENIVILESEGMVTGVLVDAVKDIMTFEEDMMVPADAALGAMRGDYIDRIGKADKHSIFLIDTAHFCDAKEKYY